MLLQLLIVLIATFTNSEEQCYKIYESGVSKTEQDEIVKFHNDYRLKIANGKVPNHPQGENLKRMKWDFVLAEAAQNTTNTCGFTYQNVTDRRWLSTGRNSNISLAYNFNKNPDWKGLIDDWFKEHEDYIFGSRYTNDVRHYTQLVWANTSYVGCGYTYSLIKENLLYQKFYLCYYGPGGNIEGEKPYKNGLRGCENLC